MARVAIFTLGTRGDFVPFLALARTFLRRGHEVVLGVPDSPAFRAACEQHHVPFVGVGHDAETGVLAWGRQVQYAQEHTKGQVNVASLVIPYLRDMYEKCLAAAAGSDVVVSHPIQPAGRMVADTLGLPFVTGVLTPHGIPSAYQPFRNSLWGRFANRIVWAWVNKNLGTPWATAINRVRSEAGLPLIPVSWDHALYSPSLNLVAVSKNVVSPRPDWTPRFPMTGYWFLDHEQWTPPPQLADFVSRPPIPVAISFGSMALSSMAAYTDILVEAVHRSGLRAVVDRGWAQVEERAGSDAVMISDAPHAWLFPRVAAVVHHGGAGTAASAFRSGVPSVFVPHQQDQAMLAATAMKLGVAAPPIPYARLTAEQLAKAMRMVVADRGMNARARQLGEAVRQEDGVGTAVALVESLLKTTR